MFTGIVTDMGEVIALDQQGDLRVRIETRYPAAGIAIGASIACEGVCLTVVATGTDPRDWFDVQISAETVSKTNIGHNGWHPGRRVNLERALKVGDELGGHIVSGHVDGVAEVVGVLPEGDSLRVTFRAPEALARFIAPKGSVALASTMAEPFSKPTTFTVTLGGRCVTGTGLLMRSALSASSAALSLRSLAITLSWYSPEGMPVVSHS